MRHAPNAPVRLASGSIRPLDDPFVFHAARLDSFAEPLAVRMTSCIASAVHSILILGLRI